jgi:hypothetical protein
VADSRFDAFTLGELDALCKALGDVKRELEGASYSLTVSKLFLEVGDAWRAAYKRASADEPLAVMRRLGGDSGLTSLEFRSGLKNLAPGDVGDEHEDEDGG